MVFQALIAHDKGKPVARQGRKAVNLSASHVRHFAPRDCLVAEGDLKIATVS
jgi:hypothetical protein